MYSPTASDLLYRAVAMALMFSSMATVLFASIYEGTIGQSSPLAVTVVCVWMVYSLIRGVYAIRLFRRVCSSSFRVSLLNILLEQPTCTVCMVHFGESPGDEGSECIICRTCGNVAHHRCLVEYFRTNQLPPDERICCMQCRSRDHTFIKVAEVVYRLPRTAADDVPDHNSEHS